MNMDDFEKRLRRQPLRKIPGEWRAEILGNAVPAAPSSFAAHHSFWQRLSSVLWLEPKAWGCLAAVWVVIFALHLVASGGTPRTTMAAAPSSSQIIMAIKDQQQLLAELIGGRETQEIDRPKRSTPQPHSERRQATSKV
jgi:hypothetical protein